MKGNFRESGDAEDAGQERGDLPVPRSSRMSLKIVLPPANGASNSSPHAFMDAGPGRANGYDVDKEYDHVMEQAMQAYLVHSRDEDLPRIEATRTIEPTPRDWAMSQESWPAGLGTERSSGGRPLLSARFGRVVRVPPTVSMNHELDVLEGSVSMSVRPKRRPLTATRIRYPITGRMSQYPFSTTPRSRSEQTTPVKVPKPSANGSTQSPPSYNSYGGGLFSRYGSKPRDFTINPEWVSENVQIAKLTLTNRNAQSTQEYKYGTYPPRRRCQSAPPPLYRNPITWQ